MNVTCLHCSKEYAVPEGSSLQGVACPQCGTPQASHFTHAKSIRFESLEQPAYSRACEHARRGEKDAALADLEEALQAGVDLELVDSDPALGKLRGDPRFARLVKRYRPE
jgi:hypothetical protein